MNPVLLAFNLNSFTSAFNFNTYFTRIGHIWYSPQQINVFRGTTVPGYINTIAADYSSSDQATIDQLYTNLASWQNIQTGFLSQLQLMARNLTVSMVQDIQPQSNQTYQTALTYIIQQMIDAGQTVTRCTVGSSYSANPDNYGNAVPVICMKTSLGVPCENSFNETVTGTVTADSYTNGATAGQEIVQFLGQYSVSNPLSQAYPVGSGANVSLTCVNGGASQIGGAQNWLNNSNFEGTWTGNTPAQWTVDVGTPGTTILRSQIIFYDGANALSFVGNGSELTSVYQTIGNSSGTTVAGSALTKLAVNLWVAVAGAPASGVLEVALTDGTGTIIQDAAGNQCVFTKSLTAIGATFVPVNGSFVTPRLLPSTVRLRIRLSTALSAGATVYIDRVAMAVPTSLYTQGPAVSVFSGNENLVDGDNYALAITNARNGKFQGAFDQLFNMRALGLLLPSTTGTPTQSDAKITA